MLKNKKCTGRNYRFKWCELFIYYLFANYLKPEDLIIQLNYLIITYLLNYFSLIIQHFAEQNYFKFCFKYRSFLFMYHI